MKKISTMSILALISFSIITLFFLLKFSKPIKENIPGKTTFGETEECLKTVFETEQTKSNYQISLNSRQFTPKENKLAGFKCLTKIPPSEKYYAFIQLYDAPSNQLRNDLDKAGIKLLNHVPKNSWFAEILGSGENSKYENIAGDIRWVGVVEPKDKMSNQFREGSIPSWALEGNKVKLVLRTYEGVPSEKVYSLIEKHSGQLLSEGSFYTYTVQVDKTAIKSPAIANFISYIDYISPPPTTN